MLFAVARHCGQVTAGTVDILLSTMSRSMVRDTVQRIRRLLKDPAFLAVVNELNLSAGPIKDPKAAEKALSDRLKDPGMAIWTYAEPTEARQPTEAKQQFVRVREQDVMRDGRIKTRPSHLRRLISSGQEWGPPYSAKREGSPHGPGPGDMSGGDRTEGQPTESGPGEEWVRPYKQHRHGRLFPIRGYARHRALSAQAAGPSGGTSTDETDTDADQSIARQRQADAEAYLQRKLDALKATADGTDTSGSNIQSREPWIPDFAEQVLHEQGYHYRQGQEAAVAYFKDWEERGEPSDYKPPDNPDFRRGFADKYNEIMGQAKWNKRVRDASDFLRHLIGLGPTGPKLMTNKEAAEAASKLGYTVRKGPDKLPFDSHGQPAYYNPKTKTYITQDVDSHIGGVWKMFKGKVRQGTFDAQLKPIGK